jgi:myo-inositol-1(or 4)-monophosphatase
MLNIDIDTIIEWVMRAAELAPSYRDRGDLHYKADGTPVTSADLSIQQFLRRKIAERYPEHSVLGEEDVAAIASERLWVIDPIDGTAAFWHDLPVWCISIGFLENYEPVLGVIHAPGLGETYDCDEQGRVRRNRAVLPSRPPSASRVPILCVSPRATRAFRFSFDGQVLSLGSGAYHACRVARGDVLGSLTLAPGLWDLAGVAPILRNCGCELYYLDGAVVSFRELVEEKRVRGPVLICRPDALAGLLATIIPLETPLAPFGD